MQDVRNEISHDGVTYPVVFNINVMERVQEVYGSVDAWADYTDGTMNGKINYEKKHGEGSWDELNDEQKIALRGEPDAKSIIFGFTEMINEGIDIDNETLKEPRQFLTTRQVGRLITAIGLAKATQNLKDTVIASQKVEGEEAKNA